MRALLVLLFNLLCSCATSGLLTSWNYYDTIITFSSSDFTLKGSNFPGFCNQSVLIENNQLQYTHPV